MRLFLAILPDPDMRDALCAVQHELRRRGVEGNFTRPENLHLTLAFIGDYPDPDAVLEALSELRFEPFSLALDGLGAFGELWWAGLRGNEALDALVRRLRRALAEAGIPFDRKRFSAHITLARQMDCDLRALAGLVRKIGAKMLSAVTLFISAALLLVFGFTESLPLFLIVMPIINILNMV